MDCFRPDEFPDTLMRTAGGPALASVADMLTELCAAFQVAGFSLVEYVERGGRSLDKLRGLMDRVA
jgi:arginase family enzyme